MIQKADGFDSEKLLVLPDYIMDDLSSNELTRGLYISDIGYFPRAKHHYRERLDGCDSHIVICCSAGVGWVELIGDKIIDMFSQSLIIIPAGTAHRYGAADRDPWSIYWFHLRGDLALSFFRHFSLVADRLNIPISIFVKIVGWFEQCYELMADKPYSIHHYIHVSQTMRYLFSTVGLTTGGSPHQKKREKVLESAIRYMTEHINEAVKLEELAHQTTLSKQHLIYLFKETTGFPPIDYFLRMKMQRACQMLDLTDLSIKEISNALGIPDPYYFSRLFKKINGCSPSGYRNIQKG